ncbi:MAG: hypothetical protein HAW66_06850 [Shewanella sp.]|nr:hypothetical protein [Shewanella sp.]
MKKIIAASAVTFALSTSYAFAGNTVKALAEGLYGQNIELNAGELLELASSEAQTINFVSREAFRLCNPETLSDVSSQNFTTNRFKRASIITDNGTIEGPFFRSRMKANGNLEIPFIYDVTYPEIGNQEDDKTYVVVYDSNKGQSVTQACIEGKKFTVSLLNDSKLELQETITELQDQNVRQNDWLYLTQSAPFAFEYNATSQHLYSVKSLDSDGRLRIKHPNDSDANFNLVRNSRDHNIYWSSVDQYGNPTIRSGRMGWITGNASYGFFTLNSNDEHAPKPGQAIIIETQKTN